MWSCIFFKTFQSSNCETKNNSVYKKNRYKNNKTTELHINNILINKKKRKHNPKFNSITKKLTTPATYKSNASDTSRSIIIRQTCPIRNRKLPQRHTNLIATTIFRLDFKNRNWPLSVMTVPVSFYIFQKFKTNIIIFKWSKTFLAFVRS